MLVPFSDSACVVVQVARAVQRAWKTVPPRAACTLHGRRPLLSNWVAQWLFGGPGHPGVREAVRDAPEGGALCAVPPGAEFVLPFVCELAAGRCTNDSLPCVAYDTRTMHYHTLRRFLSDGRPFERLECGDVACDVGAGAAATAAADGVIMDAWTVGGPLHEASAAVVRSLLWPRARVERGQQWAYTAVGESAAYYPWLEEGTRWRVLS